MLELNRKIMQNLIALFGLSILLSLSACFQGFKPATQGSHVNYDKLLSQNSVFCEGISIAFDKTADWDADDAKGFIAQIQLTHVGSQPVDWQLEFDFDAQITNMWNASYTLSNGNHYTVNPASWNTRIDPNQTINFGFQGTYTSEQLVEPQNVSCNGQEQEKPYDPYEGFNGEAVNELQTTDEELLRRYNEALADLSPAQRNLLLEGELVFNGYTFGPRSPVGGAYGTEGLYTQQAIDPTSQEQTPQEQTPQTDEEEKPFDPYEGFTGDPIDPSELQTTDEELLRRYNEALADLSPTQRRLLAEGRLHFDGYSFGPMSPLGGNYVPEPLGTQETDATPQEQTPQIDEEEKPYDPYEGFTGDPIDPSELQTTDEEIAQRYNEAYEALSPENKRLVDIGRLFFNGFTFVPRPHNYDPLPPPQEQTPQTGEEGK